MYTHIRPNYFARDALIRMSRSRFAVPLKPTTQKKPKPTQRSKWVRHERGIFRDLRELGVSWYGFTKLAIQYLPHVIHPDEIIHGIVYGFGSAILVATDRRAIYINKKLLWVEEDEVTYDVVSGVSFTHTALRAVVRLHTRVKDYVVPTLNQQGARRFVEYIESRCLEHTESDASSRLRAQQKQ